MSSRLRWRQEEKQSWWALWVNMVVLLEMEGGVLVGYGLAEAKRTRRLAEGEEA